MNVNSTTGADGSTGGASQASASQQSDASLGQDAFMQLLVTQLQHQDPTQPMDDQTFLTQLATFTSLEKLSQIADAVTAMRDELQQQTAMFQSLGGNS